MYTIDTNENLFMETGSRRKNLLPVSIVIIPQKQPKYKSCTAMRRMLYSISNVERGMAMEKDWMVLLQQHNQLGQEIGRASWRERV